MPPPQPGATIHPRRIHDPLNWQVLWSEQDLFERNKRGCKFECKQDLQHLGALSPSDTSDSEKLDWSKFGPDGQVPDCWGHDWRFQIRVEGLLE